MTEQPAPLHFPRVAHGAAITLMLVTLLISPALLAETQTQSNQYAGILNRILIEFQEVPQQWESVVMRYATILFILLALIELTWIGASLVLEKDDFASMMAEFIQKLMWLLFFYVLLLNGPDWIAAIIDSFVFIGQQAASGAAGLSPSGIFGEGFYYSARLINAVNELGFFTAIPVYLVVIPGALIILFAFALMAAQLLIALIESYIAISAALIFLGFGGSRWTVGYVYKYLGYVMSTGVKLFFVYLVISIGLEISRQWEERISQIGSDGAGILSVTLTFIGSSMVLASIAMRIPDMAAGLLGGTPAMNLSTLKSDTQVAYHDIKKTSGLAKDAAIQPLRQGAGMLEAWRAARERKDSHGGTTLGNMATGMAKDQWNLFTGQSYRRPGTTIGGRTANIIRGVGSSGEGEREHDREDMDDIPFGKR